MGNLIFVWLASCLLNAIIIDCFVKEIESNFTKEELDYLKEKSKNEKTRKLRRLFIMYFPIVSTATLFLLVIGYKESVKKLTQEYKSYLGKK